MPESINTFLMNDHPRKTVRVVVTGRVQGVWFRDWTAGKARALRLAGWVRNRTDHSVEALFCGPDENVDKMLALCRQGSPLSRVDDVRAITAAPYEGTQFEIRPTI